jgi:hypothetical protein
MRDGSHSEDKTTGDKESGLDRSHDRNCADLMADRWDKWFQAQKNDYQEKSQTVSGNPDLKSNGGRYHDRKSMAWSHE